MAVTIHKTFAKEFKSGLHALAQQKASKFARRVRRETVASAEEAYFDTYDKEEDPTEQTVRHGDTPLSEPNLGRRKVTPRRWEHGVLLDDMDLKRTQDNIQGAVMQGFSASFGRKTDDIIYDAALGTAAIGKTGDDTITFANESTSISGDGTTEAIGTAATPDGDGAEDYMTLAKILTMMQLFNEEDVDADEKKFWAVSPRDLNKMLDIEELTSADYVTVRTLVAGKIDTFMGFEFFWTNRLDVDTTDGTTRRTLAWAEGGIILAYIDELRMSVDRRADKRNDTQIYGEMDLGAVRMEGAKVHECLNKFA